MRTPVALSSLSVLILAAIVIWLADAMEAQTNPPVERGAPTSVEALGRLLFWDPLLSVYGARDVACATCHRPDFAYADGRDPSLGVGAIGLGPARVDMSGGRIPVVRRNSPTILNTAFNGFDGRRRRRGFDGLISPDPASAPMFWDSRVRSLEIQALDRSRPWKRCEARRTRKTRRPVSSCNDCGGGAEYVTLFEDAFGAGTTIDATRLAQAIAAFE